MHFLWQFNSIVIKTQYNTFSLFALVYSPTNVKQETSNVNIPRIMHKLNTSIIRRDIKKKRNNLPIKR